MRPGVLLLIFVVVASVLAPSIGHAGKCPADPFKASKTVWNWGILKTGQQATAMHPVRPKDHLHWR